MKQFANQARSLPGPILVIGAAGFIGANLFRALFRYRDDVFGTVRHMGLWRLEGVPGANLPAINLLDPNSVKFVLHKIKPRTVFNCSSFGAYSFESEVDLIHRTNYVSLISLLTILRDRDIAAYVHAGSSSEYGLNSNRPEEDTPLRPDSHYAVSKGAGSLALAYYGKVLGLPCANLRLYSVYGPYEDSSRLVPTIAWNGLQGQLPPFVQPETSRDFIHVDDVCSAFVAAVTAMRPELYGESFNIGTGVKTTIGELAEMARAHFGIKEEPNFWGMAGRSWDRSDWWADPHKAREALGWQAAVPLAEGLPATMAWWAKFFPGHDVKALSKKAAPSLEKTSLSVVVPVLDDSVELLQTVHAEIVAACESCALDYEIIYIDSSASPAIVECLRLLSSESGRVRGAVLSRDFGVHAALRAGMNLASKEGCVLIEGSLKDPPSLIPRFVEEWRKGAAVVYGIRVARSLSFGMRIAHGIYHKIFSLSSEVRVPENAGIFCLLDASAMQWVCQCQESDFYLQGIRGYIGFKQLGIEYKEGPNLARNGAMPFRKKYLQGKQALFAFSKLPLNLMLDLGFLLFFCAVTLGAVTMAKKLLYPEYIPQGSTLIVLLLLLFGTCNLFCIAIVGEYVGKIIDEVKRRPRYIYSMDINRGRVSLWEADIDKNKRPI